MIRYNLLIVIILALVTSSTNAHQCKRFYKSRSPILISANQFQAIASSLKQYWYLEEYKIKELLKDVPDADIVIDFLKNGIETQKYYLDRLNDPTEQFNRTNQNFLHNFWLKEHYGKIEEMPPHQRLLYELIKNRYALAKGESPNYENLNKFRQIFKELYGVDWFFETTENFQDNRLLRWTKGILGH